MILGPEYENVTRCQGISCILEASRSIVLHFFMKIIEFHRSSWKLDFCTSVPRIRSRTSIIRRDVVKVVQIHRISCNSCDFTWFSKKFTYFMDFGWKIISWENITRWQWIPCILELLGGGLYRTLEDSPELREFHTFYLKMSYGTLIIPRYVLKVVGECRILMIFMDPS